MTMLAPVVPFWRRFLVWRAHRACAAIGSVPVKRFYYDVLKDCILDMDWLVNQSSGSINDGTNRPNHVGPHAREKLSLLSRKLMSLHRQGVDYGY